MVTCELCGKEVKTTQGLRGHKTFHHATTGSNTQQPVAPLATEQQLSILEDRLELTESSWEVLDDKGRELSKQVAELATKLSKLSEAAEVTAVTKMMVDADREEFSKRLADLREAHNRQAAIINEHRDTFNNNFAVVGSRIDKIQKMVEDLGEGMSAVRTKLTTHGHDDLKSVPDLVAKVGKLEQALERMQSQIEYLTNVARRQPTGDIAELERDDKTKHYYRKYKSDLELINPHRVEPSFGDPYWVDLSEPDK